VSSAVAAATELTGTVTSVSGLPFVMTGTPVRFSQRFGSSTMGW